MIFPPCFKTLSCVTINQLTVIDPLGHLESPGPRAGAGGAPGQGGVAVSQVRRGPEAGPGLAGAARGQVNHALRPLVTIEATHIIGLNRFRQKYIKQKKYCFTRS